MVGKFRIRLIILIREEIYIPFTSISPSWEVCILKNSNNYRRPGNHLRLKSVISDITFSTFFYFFAYFFGALFHILKVSSAPIVHISFSFSFTHSPKMRLS